MRRDDLLNTTTLRYQGRKVGVLGYVPNFKQWAFIWWQDYFGSYDGGYAMSQGLHEKLKDENVELVFIKECEKLVHLEEIANGKLMDPWDPIFDGAEKRPTESQFLYTPGD